MPPASPLSWKLTTHLPLLLSATHSSMPLPSQGLREAQLVTWVAIGLQRATLGWRLWGSLVPSAAGTPSHYIISLALLVPQDLPLPYQSGSSGEVSGRRWGTCPAGCRWGSLCTPGWRPVSAGGPGSHRCPGGGNGAVSTAGR